MNDTYRVSDTIAPWIDDALDRYGMEEDILWESNLMPDKSGEPALVIFVWIKSGIVGSTVTGSISLPGNKLFGLSAQNVDEMVRVFLDRLFAARSQQLSLPSATPGLVIAR